MTFPRYLRVLILGRAHERLQTAWALREALPPPMRHSARADEDVTYAENFLGTLKADESASTR
jgi:hypothetical protein